MNESINENSNSEPAVVTVTASASSSSHFLEIYRSSCSLFAHQVGGHNVDSLIGRGLLKYFSSILKPVGSSRKCQCEKDFYAFDHPKELKKFIPKFHGIVRVKNEEKENSNNQEAEQSEYIQLDDLTEGFDRPCIVDLKMGTKTYDEEASKLKSEGDKKKYSHQETLGLRIIGIKLFDRETGEWSRKDKAWGRKLTDEKIVDGLKVFLHRHSAAIIPILLDRLSEILAWFDRQTDYRFYSSSLLIVYEGSVDPKFLDSSQVRVGMVDFTHVYGPARNKFFSLHDDSLNNSGLNLIQNQRDEGYIHGLKTLIKCLQIILEESKQENSIADNSLARSS